MKRPLIFFSASHQPSFSRIQLLTYPMAFAQPDATVPLTQKSGRKNSSSSLSPAPATTTHARLRGAAAESSGPHVGDDSVMNPRRWVRDSDSLCVASVRRSKNVNRMNTYVATYKFDDPQWAPLLLPEVTLRPSHGPGQAMNSSSPPSVPPTPPPSSSSAPSQDGNENSGGCGNSSCGVGAADDGDREEDCRVLINHNKLLSLECMARHVNFSLRHIVQKGHGVYLLHHAQHSVLQPKGIVEQSFVTCSFGIRGERLRTDIVHVGPLDAMDILDVEKGPFGQARCVFNFQKPNVLRGVIAISQVEGYGTWFQRKPMLWQRSRRIGALQSQLGAFTYDLAVPHEVGKQHDHEVFLLAPHMRFFGNGSGGAEAVGIIASSQVAQHDRLYLGEFEAPAMTALDAVHQLAHASALRSRLVTPARHPPNGHDNNTKSDDGETLETLVPVSWATRTPPPYVPLESDLPFKLQMSRPVVLGGEDGDGGRQAACPPTSGTIGSPFVRGAPAVLFEYNLHQGVDHYVFDDAPSARPMKWWSQKSNMPYSGFMYFVRSGLLDRLSPSEDIPNPLEPAARRRPLHKIVPPTQTVQRRVSRYKQKRQEAERKAKKDKSSASTPPL